MRVGPPFAARWTNKKQVCALEGDLIAKGEQVHFVSNDKLDERVIVHNRCLTSELRALIVDGQKPQRPSWLK